MRLYKTTYTYKGKLKKCKVWYLEFEDHIGLKHSIPADKDRDVSNHYGRQIDDIVNLRKRAQPLTNDLLKWVNNEIPEKIKHKLVELGIITTNNLSEGKTLAEHLSDFKDKLKVGFKPKLKSGCSDGHVQNVNRHVKCIIDGCGFRYWPDINLDEVQKYLAGLDVGDLTYNYYRQDFMQFVNWMLKSKRVISMPPGEDIPVITVEKKPTKRPLSPQEMETLLRATEGGPVRWRLTGYQRAVLYLLAVETGLRRSELASLRPECFDLEKGIVTLEREFTKNRTEAILPLKKCRIEPLRKYLSGFKEGQYLFAGWSLTHSAPMIQDDLKAAGVKIEGIKIDFHSLRRTFITALDQTTATLAEREELARHSRSYSMTLGTYTFVTPEGLQRVVEQLPAYAWPGQGESNKRKAV